MMNKEPHQYKDRPFEYLRSYSRDQDGVRVMLLARPDHRTTVNFPLHTKMTMAGRMAGENALKNEL
jgi:hypothetical protein